MIEIYQVIPFFSNIYYSYLVTHVSGFDMDNKTNTNSKKLYTQSLDGCMEQSIGKGGLPPSTVKLWLDRTQQHMEMLKTAYYDNSLPLLGLPDERQDIADAQRAMKQLMKGSENLIFFGTGGSSLGGQTLAHFSRWYVPGENREGVVGQPRVRFYNNLDGDTLAGTFDTLNLETTRFVIISKSGGTAETMFQALAAVQAMLEAGLESKIPDTFLGLTEPAQEGVKNPLRKLCTKYGIPMLDHHPDIGGRYSGLTNVGLLPAIARGMDVVKIRRGAARVINNMMAAKKAEDFAPAAAAAITVGLTLERGISNVVMMPYSDRLGRLSQWYVQLWAESLGKEGKGVTPIAAQGPVDQHSQLQLYLDGKPHMLTIIRRDCRNEGPRMSEELTKLVGVDYLAGRTAGDLVYAEQNAIHDALIEAGRPVRIIDIHQMDEEILGGLMMHFMIETILAGGLLGIDPFDQPAVERGKVLTRSYLADM